MILGGSMTFSRVGANWNLKKGLFLSPVTWIIPTELLWLTKKPFQIIFQKSPKRTEKHFGKHGTWSENSISKNSNRFFVTLKLSS